MITQLLLVCVLSQAGNDVMYDLLAQRAQLSVNLGPAHPIIRSLDKKIVFTTRYMDNRNLELQKFGATQKKITENLLDNLIQAARMNDEKKIITLRKQIRERLK